MEYGKLQEVATYDMIDFTAHPGAGISGTINGVRYFAGTRKRLIELNLLTEYAILRVHVND